MRYIKRYMCNQEFNFLELNVYDDEDKLQLSDYSGERYVVVSLEMLEYLVYLPAVTHLIITSGELKPCDLEYIYRLPLLALLIDYENYDIDDTQIDLACFDRLEYLFSRSQMNYIHIDKLQSLRTAVVSNWCDADLLSLQGSSLDSLSITKGSLRSLSGIEHVPGLKALSLSFLRRLADISALTKATDLLYLEIDNCPRIASLPPIAPLEAMLWFGNNRLESLYGLHNYPNLQRAVIEITVLDGNLDCFEQLEHASIVTNRRHYPKKDHELPKSDIPYQIVDIPFFRSITLPLCVPPVVN